MKPVRNMTISRGDRSFLIELLESCSVSDHIRETATFYELDFLLHLGEILTPDTVVFDVGAHIGNHTIFFAGVLGLRVVAFEPNPEAFAVLEENIRANDLGEQVTAIPKALSDRVGTTAMARAASTDAGTMAIVKDESAEATVEVETTVLDEFRGDIEGRVFVKADVEGHEPEVIRGGTAFIRDLRPDITVEVQSVESFDEVAGLLGAAYEPRGMYNPTPTVLFRTRETPVSAADQADMTRYGIRAAVNYAQRRNWYQAQRDRADKLAHRVGRQGMIMTALGTWLDEAGEMQVARWARSLVEPVAQRDAAGYRRILLVQFDTGPGSGALMSTVVDVVDVVICDVDRESPIRILRYVQGEIVMNLEPAHGFGRNELGAAAMSMVLEEASEQFGSLDAAVFIGGEAAPALEFAIRSFLEIPYIVISHDASYVFARLPVLTGASGVFLVDGSQVDTWNRSQIIPATVIDPAPLTILAELENRTWKGGHGPRGSHSDEGIRVLMVSYYAPPATPVSVQRLRYWHENLSSIAEGEGRSMAVTWLTATTQAQQSPDVVVVPDQGPWQLSDEWFEKYRESADLGLDPTGISWADAVSQSLSTLGGPFDVVILSGNPFHYFGLGKTFREEWGAKVILDFRDPFAYNPRFNYTEEQREHAIRLEKDWVADADVVISVNEFCLDAVAPGQSVMRHVVANGFDESIVNENLPMATKDVTPARLIYSGTVFPNLPLDDLLDAIPRGRFELHHFGRDYSSSRAAQDHPSAVAHGLVPYRSMVEEMRKSVAGIVITSGEPSTQTTKLFDYLACDLDVIIVTNGKLHTGNLHQVTADLQGIFWVKNDVDHLRRFFAGYEPTRISRPQRDRFSRRYQTTKLFELIRDLVGDSAVG